MTVKHIYSDGRSETFEGSERAVRAALLMRFPYVRTSWVDADDLEDIVGHLDHLQAFEVDIVER